MQKNTIEEEKIKRFTSFYIEKAKSGLASIASNKVTSNEEIEQTLIEVELCLMTLRMYVRHLNNDEVAFILQSDGEVFDAFVSIGYFSNPELRKDNLFRVIYHGIMGDRSEAAVSILNSLGLDFWSEYPSALESWGDFTTSKMCGSFLIFLQDHGLDSVILSNANDIALNRMNFEDFYISSLSGVRAAIKNDEKIILDAKYKMIAILRNVATKGGKKAVNCNKVSLDVHEMASELINGLSEKMNLAVYFLLIQMRDILYFIEFTKGLDKNGSIKS